MGPLCSGGPLTRIIKRGLPLQKAFQNELLAQKRGKTHKRVLTSWGAAMEISFEPVIIPPWLFVVFLWGMNNYPVI